MKEFLIEKWDTILISLIAIVAFLLVFIRKERNGRR